MKEAGKALKVEYGIVIASLFILIVAGFAQAATIRVPAVYSTIQQGINAAHNGDIVLVADGTYRGALLDWVAAHFRFRIEPVLRPEGQKGFQILPRRWVVERTFAWIDANRRLSKDYEVLTSTSEAMIYIAMTRLLIRRLAS